jgi:CHASE3 domain sensor protein
MSARSAGVLGAITNLKIKAKVLLGFAAVLALLGGVGAISVNGLNTTYEAFQNYSRTSRNTVSVAVVDRDLLLMRRNVLAYVMSGDEALAKRVRDGAE